MNRIELTPTAVYWIEKGTLTGERGNEEQPGIRIVNADGKRLLYSAHNRIPEVGDKITGPNGFGVCTVLGYFTEDGYFGVLCKPVKPPKWFVQQEKRNAHKASGPIGLGNIGLFGAEFEFVRFWNITQGASKAKVRGDDYDAAVLRAKEIGFDHPDSVVLID